VNYWNVRLMSSNKVKVFKVIPMLLIAASVIQLPLLKSKKFVEDVLFTKCQG